MSGGSEEDNTPYFHATRDELLLTFEDPSRVRAVADLVAPPFKVERVLDVGCGVGQALFPLAVSRDALGVGVDISDAALRMGREVYETHLPGAKIAFAKSAAESLPFADASFDVVNCGLALPYTDNARVIAEVARVLRPGGMFLLKIHHARYYLDLLRRGLARLEVSSVIYGGRVLAAGTLYHLTGRQPRVRFLNESFQTRRLLRRELSKHGLSIEREHVNTNPLTPHFVISKGR